VSCVFNKIKQKSFKNQSHRIVSDSTPKEGIGFQVLVFSSSEYLV